MKYGKWIKGLFGPRRLNESELAWNQSWERAVFALSAEETIDLITRLFENAGTDLAPFSDEQVAIGLKFVTDTTSGDLMRRIDDRGVSIVKRLAMIQSIYVLYRDFLALRCENCPGKESTRPIDIYAYMFWDSGSLCVYSLLKSNDESKDELIEAVLEVLEKTLTIPNETCQLAALHGLGHSLFDIDCVPQWKKRILKAIDEYCKRSNISSELRKYAKEARTGMIM